MKIIYYIENNSGIVVSIFFKVSIKYLLLMNFLCSHSHKLLLNIPDSNSPISSLLYFKVEIHS